MKKTVLPILLLILLLPLAGEGQGEAAPAADRMTAFVSILPQAYLLERIAGDLVDVEVMVTPGKSPATYEPSPQQMVSLGSAKVFFSIGVAFEKAFVPTLESTLPELDVIHAAAGIERRMMGAHSHDDEHDDEHEEHASPDPHVWMSPVNAKILARNMAQYLMDKDSANRAAYEANLADLESDLDGLHAHMQKALAPHKGEVLFVYHPAFGYLADLYGLRQETIETGGKEPTPSQLEEIIEHAREEGSHVIFVQPEFSQSSAKAVAEAIDGKVVTVAPLKKDYLENMKDIAQALESGLE